MTGSHDELLTLYKYRSLSGQWGRSAAEDIVLHNRMCWQSPAEFNDPFDCNPYWVFGESAFDRKSFVDRTIANQLKGSSRHVRRSKRREMSERSAHDYELEARTAFSEWMAESAVTCFSSVNNSILMWGHYARSHTGLCFIFRETLVPQPFVAFEVTYEQARLPADITKLNGAAMLERAVLMKAQEWSYEHEFRMFEYREPPGLRSFPPQSLTGVIFGAKMSGDDREFVENLIARRQGAPLDRFDAVVHEREFRIEIVACSDQTSVAI